MTTAQKPLRLWPGVVAVAIQLLARYVVPIFLPEALPLGVLGGLLCALAVLIWWAFFSRAARFERWSAVLLIVVSLLVESRFIDKSIATGMMGFMFPVFAFPAVTLAFVVWAVVTQNLSTSVRRATMVATIVLACGAFSLIRTNGITGEASSDFAFRWTKTAEERLVEQAKSRPAILAPVAAASAPITAIETSATVAAPTPTIVEAPKPIVVATAPAWPGFRGPHRDSIIPNTHIKTDWSASPPVQLWRRPVGPGWSSFAVSGDLLYTQEQLGEEEVVSCYNATNGNPVWAHRDTARFWESNAGAGPRGTPTLHNGHVYTFGATGILNALSAADGSVIWTRNAASDTKVKLPGWGFSSSPLIIGDTLIIATGGELAAYDLATGSPRWTGPAGGGGYSSPHLATIAGVQQILLTSYQGVTSVAPADGTLLWKYSWPGNTRIVQPAVMEDGDLLIEGGESSNLRRIAVTHGSTGWNVEERWTTTALKPYFNDFIVHDGHVFGFDGAILACVDIKDGKRKWKGGRYGHGQMVLLENQGVFLVLSEEGELALVKADTGKFTELAKFPAMSDKTWNHPVLVGERLFVRNGVEMVAFRLPVEAR